MNNAGVLIIGLMMAAASGIAVEYRLRIDQSEMIDRQADLEIISEEYSRISSAFDTQREEMEKLNLILERQNLLIAGLTGQSNAIELPPEGWDVRLRNLQLTLSDSTKREENVAQAASHYDEVVSLINESAPGVQSYYLDRLMSVRWSADVFLHLNERANLEWRELDDYIAERRELITIYPLDANSELYDFLTEGMDELTRDANSQIREQVMNQANERIEKDAEIDELYDSLNWLDEIALLDDQEVQEMRSTIELRVREIEVIAQVDEFDRQIDVINDMSSELRAPAASILLNEVTQYWLAFEQNGLRNDRVAATHQKLSDYLVSTRKQDEEASNLMLRDYRRWALESIVRFEEALEQHKAKPREGTFSNGLSDEGYFQGVRGLVGDNLFMINEVHLDYLLSDQYRKALGSAISVLSVNNVSAKAALNDMIEDSISFLRKNPIPVPPYHD